MKKGLLFMVLVFALTGVQAQKYFTRTGQISFFSSTAVEDIEAHNKAVTGIFDVASGAIQFSVAIKSFHFEKALMEEHFNENYMESTKFPKSTFSGKIQNIGEIDFSKDGVYPVVIVGKLTMHGVTKEVTVKGTFTIKNGEVLGEAKMMINPEDYKVTIPDLVREKIAKELEVTVKMNFKEKK